MAGPHIHLQQGQAVIGPALAQASDEFGRLPIGHARVGETTRGEDVGIGHVLDLVVGRVLDHRLIIFRALDRIAPFRPFRRGQGQFRVRHGVDHVDEGNRCNGAGKQVGLEIDRRTDEQAAGRTAIGNNLSARGIAELCQGFAGGDKITESVDLVFQLAVQIPLIAIGHAATDMGGGIDHAAIHQRERGDAEGGRNGDAVGAIAIQHQRRAAIDRRVAVIQDGDRDLRAVMALGHDAANDIILRIVTGGHFLALQQRAFLAAQIVVIRLFRRGRALIGEAQHIGRELVTGRGAQRIGLLVEVDIILLAGRIFMHDDTRQGVFALDTDLPVGKADDAIDQRARTMGNKVLPVLATRIVERGRDDLVIDGTIQICPEVETVAGFGEIVFNVILAGRDQHRIGSRIIGVEQADLVRGVPAGIDDDVIIVVAQTDRDEIAVIGLLIDQLGRTAIGGLTIDPLGPAIIVAPDPVQRGAVIGPGEIARAFVGQGRDDGAGGDVLDPDLVILGTAHIDAEGDIAVVGRVLHVGEVEIVEIGRLGVAINEDFLLADQLTGLRVDRAAREDRILAALAIAGEIGVVAIPLGDRAVIFLDAATDLLEDSLLQCLCRCHDGVEIGILRVQQRADIAVQDVRLAHDLLPVFVLDPLVFVDPGEADLFDRDRTLLGARGFKALGPRDQRAVSVDGGGGGRIVGRHVSLLAAGDECETGKSHPHSPGKRQITHVNSLMCAG